MLRELRNVTESHSIDALGYAQMVPRNISIKSTIVTFTDTNFTMITNINGDTHRAFYSIHCFSLCISI